jgi:uncharacterized protein YukE
MAVKMATFQAEQKLAQFQQSINPIQTAYQGFQAKATERRFESKYPELVKHKNLVTSVVAQLKNEGKQFDSVDKAMDEAASRAKVMLQEAGVSLTSPKAQSKVSQPAMASVGPGGAGTNKSTSSAQSKSHGLNVLKKAFN